MKSQIDLSHFQKIIVSDARLWKVQLWSHPEEMEAWSKLLISKPHFWKTSHQTVAIW